MVVFYNIWWQWWCWSHAVYEALILWEGHSFSVNIALTPVNHVIQWTTLTILSCRAGVLHYNWASVIGNHIILFEQIDPLQVSFICLFVHQYVCLTLFLSFSRCLSLSLSLALSLILSLSLSLILSLSVCQIATMCSQTLLEFFPSPVCQGPLVIMCVC